MLQRLPSSLSKLAAETVSGEERRLTYGAVTLGIVTALLMSAGEGATVSLTWAALFLWLCVAYFWWEWLVRLAAAFDANDPLSYLLSGQGLIDTAAALAVPLAVLSGVGIATASLLGVVWLFKPVPHITGLRPLKRVLSRESGPLLSVLMLFVIVLFMAAVLVHLFERQVQPSAFGSLPASLWWAVVTLTTTGYGDIVPVTPGGRMVAALLMVSGLGVFGLWTGILANGFAAETRRHNSIQTWDSLSKVPFFSSLGPATLADVAHLLRRVDLRQGTTVVRRGDAGDCMYFVAAGAVAVDLPGKRIPLGVGSFFGELALLGNHARSADVITTAPTTLLVLDLVDFRGLMARHPDLARAIDEEAARRAAENKV